MKRTRLMSKLFSDSTPQEYKEKVFDKIDEALENGSSTLDEDGELIQFAENDGDVVIEDQTDGANEVTKASIDENDPTNYVLSEVEIPAEEPTEEPTEAPTEEAVESITIERPASMSVEDDDDQIEEESVVDIKENEEGDTAFSLKFKNFSRKRIEKYTKVFTSITPVLDDVVKSANINTDIKVKFEGDQMKFFSETEEHVDVTEVIAAANEIAEMAKEGINKDNAEDVKAKAEGLLEMAEKVEEGKAKLECIKAMSRMYSEEAAKVIDEQDPTEEPTEAPTEAATEEPTEAATEAPTEEPTEAPTEEVKTESIHQVIQCPETGKWCIEGDPDNVMYDTQEEAEEVRAKSFSDPTVTVTIENLEPASVADLLGANKDDDLGTKEDPNAPKIDPNDGEGSRQFSLKPQVTSINPYLTTEIN